MNIHFDRPRVARCQRIIALHCSGAGAGQWDHLAEQLGNNHELLAPEQYGCASSGAWTGEHAFTLADEAARTIALIDEAREQIHLVGHSYGGGVALHVALARPDRIASMALYEPSAFHLLQQMGETGVNAFAEIAEIAQRVGQCVVTGDYRNGIAEFVNYWNGPNAWDQMRPAAQSALIRWAPKGPLDFRALIEEPTPMSAYRTLMFPILIACGERGPMPSRAIAQALANLLPNSRLAVVPGAGHMGPLTHAQEVSSLIIHHITTFGWAGTWLPTAV
jgi:pimeloyl-ACP methyl ester carboxylesterase